MYTIGIDVGGMSIKGGLVSQEEIKIKSTVQTNQIGGGDTLVSDIELLVGDILKQANITIEEIESIGVGIPGPVTSNNHVSMVNLNIEDYPLDIKLKEKFKNTKIAIGNDANVAAYCEYKYGSMKGYKSGVMITLGTGLGGGIVVNDSLISGTNGIAAEIGHMIIGENYYDCNCGNNGCFETFCSATAIIKYTQTLVSNGRETIIRQMCEDNLENITAKMVFDAYKENDELALEIVERFRKYLAIGLANIVNFIDPGVITIGGGVSNASEILLEGMKERILTHLPFKKTKIADISIATFKNDAGILGSSAL